MPRFKTDEAEARWRAAISRARKKQVAVVQEDGSVAMRTSGSSSAIVNALEEIDSKIAALQSARQALMRADELVRG